jgi:His-Xaa-Ser system radical SAM maturase HxsC
MGPLKPLVLSGAVAQKFRGANASRLILRLRSVHDRLEQPVHDAAILRSANDVRAAAARGFTRGVDLSDTGIDSSAFEGIDVMRPGECFDHLRAGDVLGYEAGSGRLRVHFRKEAPHNALLVTERCNNYCLMCSQPPKVRDDGWIHDELAKVLPLVDPETAALTFTGGEPLTEPDRFMALVAMTRDLLPKTAVHVLSNGRAFATPSTARRWAEMGHPRLSVGIPVYAAVDHIHDHVVQARGAFDETILGILRLKDQGQRVEIRVVLHALTTGRLVQTCAWIARNLPFVDHVALMGLEHTGFALANSEMLWIDPIDYAEELREGVEILSAANVPISIYNLPLCVLPESVRRFAMRSISDWKNAFPDECSPCSARDQCAGFFSTGRPRVSRGLQPMLESATAA